jgi:hypothetical protein
MSGGVEGVELAVTMTAYAERAQRCVSLRVDLVTCKVSVSVEVDK